MLMRSLLAALLLASTATRAQAPANGVRQAERSLLEKAVEIPTVAGRTVEFHRMTALLTAELKKGGISNVVVKDHDGTQTLIARWPAERPSGRKPILLMAHMDVVEANPADWKNPPFEFREKDGYYLGRGVSDNKAELVGIVLALQNLKRSGFKPARDIIVLFTGDEETTGNGARRAVGEWRSLTEAEFALNFDAGDGKVFPDGRAEGFLLQVAEKTYADYRLLATNRGGHSSAPRPDNAIYALGRAIKALEDHRFQPMINDATRGYFQHLAANDGGRFGELVKRFLANPADREAADQLELNDPGVTRTRCVPTMLSGGHAPNALPQRAEATVNCRIFPGVSIEAVRQELQTLSGPDVAVTVVSESTTPEAAASPLRQDVVDAYQAAVRTRFPDAPIIPEMSPGASDGAFLRAAGIPVYGVGGTWTLVGASSGAHGLDERVLVDAFHGQIPITEEIIRRLAG